MTVIPSCEKRAIDSVNRLCAIEKCTNPKSGAKTSDDKDLAGLMNHLALGADHKRAAVRQLAGAVDVDKVALVGDRAGARCRAPGPGR